MTPDPKLVWVCSCGCGFGVTGIPQSKVGTWECSDGYPLDPTPLRLVQLPEEPSGWVSPETAALIHNSEDVEVVVIDRHPYGSLPVYILPADPQEVEP